MSRNTYEALTRLAKLTRMLRENELAELKKQSQEVASMKSRIDDISRAAEIGATKIEEWPDPALVSGQGVRFHNWAKYQIESLNTELAKLRSAQEVQLLTARRAYGRNEVLDQLRANAKRDALDKDLKN